MSRTVRIVLCVLGVLIASAALALLAEGAVANARGQRLDELVLRGAEADPGPLARVVFPVLNTVSIPVVAIALVIAVVIVLLRRRYRVIAQMAVLTLGANLTTQVLKTLLDRSALTDQISVTPNSFPSGHMTLAASLAVAVALAVPQGMRSLTGLLGAAWTAAAGIGTIALGWHRPSDALGALLVVAAWSYLVLLFEPRPEVVDPTGTARRRHSGATGALVLGAAAVVAAVGATLAVLALPTPLRLEEAGDQSVAYTASTLAVIACTAAVIATVLTLRAPDPQRSRTVERVP